MAHALRFWAALVGAPAACRDDPVAERRARRVLVLLVGILVLSLADLMVTLEHLRTIGMLEANPIAAYLIRTTRSPWVLSAYKCLTVGICVTLLHRLRHHRSGELAAWCAMGILTVMSVLWHTYSQELGSTAHLQTVQADHGEQWLRLD
jgi:hypothetical protein